jgi:hypothetical protein
MNRVPRFGYLLAAAGLSVVLLGACAGPTAPPGDAGFGTTVGSGTGGSYYGSGGSYGTGGYPGSTGGYYGGGTGGYYGGGTGGFVGSWDAGAQLPFDSGTPPPGGGGGGRPVRGVDAGPITVCPPDAMNDARCIMGGVTCIVPAADGGRQQICSCRTRPVSNIGNWSCYQP